MACSSCTAFACSVAPCARHCEAFASSLEPEDTFPEVRTEDEVEIMARDAQEMANNLDEIIFDVCDLPDRHIPVLLHKILLHSVRLVPWKQ